MKLKPHDASKQNIFVHWSKSEGMATLNEKQTATFYCAMFWRKNCPGGDVFGLLLTQHWKENRVSDANKLMSPGRDIDAEMVYMQAVQI